MFTIQCKGQLVQFDQPKIMGIINITPDSFFEGNRKLDISAAVDMAGNMLEEGASFLDLGAQSSRPGSQWIEANEESDRLLPTLEAIVKAFPDAHISIDTFHSLVANAALQIGAAIINDISGGNIDAEMIPTVGKWQAPYICMHMRGTPQNMQEQTDYDNIDANLIRYFAEKKEYCLSAGIKDFILDPGLGFSKTTNQNFHLLKNLQAFKTLNVPILVGVSRKGMIYKTLKTSPTEALNGSTVLHTLAILNGANILRVHDIKEVRETITLLKTYQEA